MFKITCNSPEEENIFLLDLIFVFLTDKITKVLFILCDQEELMYFYMLKKLTLASGVQRKSFLTT